MTTCYTTKLFNFYSKVKGRKVVDFDFVDGNCKCSCCGTRKMKSYLKITFEDGIETLGLNCLSNLNDQFGEGWLRGGQQ